ncbi:MULTISPECIES: HTTM domain-containing protein [Streptomyces]|uniref:HTTM domain-containing protein n=1 Tax=Streptomyces TaxID=1883 RepID=UPI00163C5E3B|nr:MULTISPECIES: HTTM domain-containing protein [Streptomyces]MBC2873656.1 HTTM domain-containing protein [Streptomyces sp. TYQ1024]UBI37912.1 HTTM domain-containing protein [Streptomyces mobaraensis]UKW30499.1 HTTM domain-containing protein [Streptomyces sp. TYQ1024]
MSLSSVRTACSTAYARVTGRSLGPYQTALIRIGFSFTWLFFLAREWVNRHELYGPDAAWSWDLARRLTDDNGSFTVLMWSDSGWWFELVYLMAMVSALLLMLGWRTRTMSVLYMIGLLSLQNRSVFVGDGGDNVLHLMAIYTVFTRCGQVWSLDARRARRRAAAGPDGEPDPGRDRDVTGVVLWTLCGLALALATTDAGTRLAWAAHGPVPGIGWATVLWSLWCGHGLWWAVRRYGGTEPRAVMAAFGHLTHNAALLVILAEVCLIYGAAGWYKVQGSLWQDGTALYYPLHLDYFSPWPGLSHALAASGVVVLLLSYGTVAVQAAFPLTLINRRVKNALVVVMIAEHLGIAVLLGLPFFSLVMVFADAVFLPTVFLVRAGGAVGRTVTRGWNTLVRFNRREIPAQWNRRAADRASEARVRDEAAEADPARSKTG